MGLIKTKEAPKQTLEQQVQRERESIKDRVQSLLEDRAGYQEELNGLQQDYQEAILSDADEHMDTINEQIKALKGKMTHCQDKIDALENQQGAAIGRLVEEASAQTIAIMKQEEAAVRALEAELQPHHAALMTGMKELDQRKHRLNNLSSILSDNIQRYPMKNVSKELTAYSDKIGRGNVGVDAMNRLLIERHQAFKMR